MFIVGSYVRFQSFEVLSNMSVESVIEKLWGTKREKENQRNDHRRRWEEEAKLLKTIEVEEELKRAKRIMLNI